MSRSSPVHITSTSHLTQVLSSNTYVVADFFATWCGPCKAIAPLFDQLAGSESKQGRMAFVKIDVDGQPEIAKTYGVSAMPTFLIFKNSSVIDTIRGADTGSLRSAIMRASTDAAKGPARQSAAFQSKGQTLGGEGSNSSSSRTGGAGGGFASWMNVGPRFGITGQGLGADPMSTLARFFGLYFTSLFAFDSYSAAEGSAFNAKSAGYGRTVGRVG